MTGGQGLFSGGFESKLACTGAANELSSTLVRGSHVIAWLGSKLQLSGTQLRGTHAIAWVGSKLQPSGTQLRGFPRNCVAPHTFKSLTSDNHNFFLRTLFRVFLDSMESPLSQDSNHVPLEDSW